MLVAEFQQYFFGFSIFISSLFLVMLVLVQRGRGGGLTGALGGAGGQSAFGTKAGDLFTRITVAVAAVWIFLCAAAVFFLRDRALPQTGVDDRNIPAATGTVTPGTPPAVDLDLGEQGAVTPSATTPSTTTPSTTTPSATTPSATTPSANTEGPVGDVGETPAGTADQPAGSELPAEAAPLVPSAPAATDSPTTPPAEQPNSSAADSPPVNADPAVPGEDE